MPPKKDMLRFVSRIIFRKSTHFVVGGLLLVALSGCSKTGVVVDKEYCDQIRSDIRDEFDTQFGLNAEQMKDNQQRIKNAKEQYTYNNCEQYKPMPEFFSTD